ncbi:MAG: hypothetical protein ACQESP_04710 [Candidatus Muiribacteriota bacterium]
MLNLINKKGFLIYFVAVFVIIIFGFSMFFFNRISASGHSITREMGLVSAEKLTQTGLNYTKKIIYENLYEGNYNFHETMELPQDIEHDEGEISIISIELYDLNAEQNSFDLWKRGASRGERNYYEIIIKAECAKFKTVLESKSILEIDKVEYFQ